MIETRKTEIHYSTSDPAKMLGRFLAKSVYKTWQEDFLDKDTQETVTRALVDDNLRWIRFDGKPVEDDTEEPAEPGTGGGTGGEDEDLFG